jgi:hypothetical protein
MTFEDDFPSLKGKVYDSVISEETGNEMKIWNGFIRCTDVEDYLLDKQKVRDAINKLARGTRMDDNGKVYVSELLKELEL